jgi:two-component system nitrogen regulation response regulator GlnG
MPPLTQAKVLRVLQEQAFERVGGGETVRTDVRVLAATHRNLTAMVADGRFRPDLYYRLGVFTVTLPSLRERGADLPLLVRHYLRRLSRELGRAVREADPEALALLKAYSWPGNIRELQSVLKQALLRARGEVLLPAFLPDLPEALAEAPALPTGDSELESLIRARLGSGDCDLHADVYEYVDRLLLTRVLEHTGGSQHQAARRLGIARETLRKRLRELGLHVSRTVAPAEDEVPLTPALPTRQLA